MAQLELKKKQKRRKKLNAEQEIQEESQESEIDLQMKLMNLNKKKKKLIKRKSKPGEHFVTEVCDKQFEELPSKLNTPKTEINIPLKRNENFNEAKVEFDLNGQQADSKGTEKSKILRQKPISKSQSFNCAKSKENVKPADNAQSELFAQLSRRRSIIESNTKPECVQKPNYGQNEDNRQLSEKKTAEKSLPREQVKTDEHLKGSTSQNVAPVNNSLEIQNSAPKIENMVPDAKTFVATRLDSTGVVEKEKIIPPPPPPLPVAALNEKPSGTENAFSSSELTEKDLNVVEGHSSLMKEIITGIKLRSTQANSHHRPSGSGHRACMDLRGILAKAVHLRNQLMNPDKDDSEDSGNEGEIEDDDWEDDAGTVHA